MDELEMLQEQAGRMQVKLAGNEIVADNSHLIDVWRAIDMLAGHIMMLREGSNAGK
jgi:hypothetical protein